MIICSNKTLTQLASDYSNGLGQLQCIDPLVTEELNGTYELEFNILVSDPHFDDLEVGSILKTTANDHDGLQMFRVYYISKELNGQCTVRAQHITYDLTKTPVSTFSATGASSACANMMSHVIGTTEFSLTTDITNTVSNFTLDIPRSFRECLGGYEGSLLDVFRGEYHWDNLSIEMLAHRGHDNGVRIAYGKNLTDLKQEESIDSVYTSVLGYAVVDEVCYIGTVYDKIVTSNPKVKIVDFSGDYESGNVPTSAELTTKAQNYATNNDIEIPNVNLTISFIHLWQTEEYKDVLPIERVSLGDTVHVYFEKLGVEASARVIKTTWNPNLERYESIELGSARANLNTILNDVANETIETIKSSIDLDTSAIESEMFSISKLIVNGMGLHISRDAQDRIILHNEEQISQSQYQYMIGAQGFMLSDDYGQHWNSGWDISGNAVVNSLATITLKFLEGYGMYMRFGDVNSNYIEVAPYSENNVPQGVSFDGTGYVRFRPQERFIVNNLNSSNNLLNEFVMGSEGTYNQPFIVLKNYDHLRQDGSGNFLLANAIEMDAATGNSHNHNQMLITNNSTASGTEWKSNEIKFDAQNTFGTIEIGNFKTDGNYFNQLVFQPSAPSTSGGQGNDVYLRNYKYNSNALANSLSLTYADNAGVPRQSQASISNYDNSGTRVANGISMVSAIDSDQITITNRKKSATSNADMANEIKMMGLKPAPDHAAADDSYLTITNYDVDSNQISTAINLYKNSYRNYLEILLNRAGQMLGTIRMQKGTDQSFVITLETYVRDINDTHYKSTGIQLNAVSGDVELWGDHLYWNGNVKW